MRFKGGPEDPGEAIALLILSAVVLIIIVNLIFSNAQGGTP